MTAPTPNALGLSQLLSWLPRSQNLTKAYWHARDNVHAKFDKHPFGHPVELRRPAGCSHNTYLVAFAGDTGLSVTGLVLILHNQIATIMLNENDFRLRITRVQIDLDQKDQSQFMHDLYFELVTWWGTFICGGCNDGTGEGGHGGRDLEAIFRLVGDLFNVPVEEAVIPAGRQQEFKSLFYETHRRHNADTHAA